MMIKKDKILKIKEMAVKNKTTILTPAEVKFLKSRGVNYKTLLNCQQPLLIMSEDDNKTMSMIYGIAAKTGKRIIRMIRHIVKVQEPDVIQVKKQVAKVVKIPEAPFKTIAELPKIKKEEPIKEKTYKLSGPNIWDDDDDDY